MQALVHTVLLDIYRAATGVPSPVFKDIVFASLCRHLDFDSAGWGTFALTPQGAKVHSVHVYKLPMQMMVDYEAVKQYDTLSAMALARAGRTINVSVDNTRWKLHPDIVEHIRKWGLNHALGTINVNLELNICNAISLYRNANSQPFSSKERYFKQQLMVHMVEAWNLNNMRYINQGNQVQKAADSMTAVVDDEGMIYNADAGLHALLSREFPDWTGPMLPPVISKCLLTAEPIVYRGVHVSCKLMRRYSDGMILVCVRVPSALDQLTNRESMVATLFANGKSHKEIAIEIKNSPATVRNQLQSVYMKLGVGSKIELAKALREYGN